MAASLGQLLVTVGANIEGFERAMGTVSQRLGAVVRDADKAGAGFVKLGDRLTKVGMGLTAALTVPLAGVAVVATKAFSDFDAAMTQSLAIMGDVSTAMRDEMTVAARKMALESIFSAKQAADSYFFLASAGLDAKASVAALPVVTKFAQAGMFDMALATDLLTDAQSALGLTIRDDAVANMNNMVKVSDVLVKANTLANASVQQFSEALTNKAGAALKALGKDIEEGVAVLAAFADQGVKGAEGGTQFAIVLRDLQTKAIENKEEFRHLGIAVFDSQGKMRNMADIIGDLEKLLAGMSDEQKKATLLTMGFSDKSIAAMLALLGTSDAIRGYEKELRNAGGTTDEVSKKQLETFKAQMTLLQHRLTDTAISIGKSLVPAIEAIIRVAEPVLSLIEGLARKFGELPPSMQLVIIGFGGMLAALGPLAIGAGQLIKAFGLIQATVLNLGPSLVGMATGALPALGGAIQNVAVAVQTNMVGALTLGEKALLAFGAAAGIAAAAFVGWKLGQWIGENVADKIPVLEDFGDKTSFLGKALDILTGSSKKTAEGMAALAAQNEDLAAELKKQGVIVERGTMSHEEYTKALIKAAREHIPLRQNTQATTKAQTDLDRASGKVTLSLKAQKKAQEEAKKAADELNKALETLGIRTKADKQREEYREAWLLIEKAFGKGKITAGEYSVALGALRKKLDDLALETMIQDLEHLNVDVSKIPPKFFEWSTNVDALAAAFWGLRREQQETWDSLNIGLGAYSRLADMVVQYGAMTVPGAMEAQTSAILKANQEVETHTSEWKKLGNQVSTIMTDMSKGIADVIWDGGKMGDVFKGVFEEMGKAVTRFVIEYLEGKLLKVLANLLDDILPSIGRALGSIFGTTGGTAAGGVAGATTGTAGTTAGGGAGGDGFLGGIGGGIISAGATLGVAYGEAIRSWDQFNLLYRWIEWLGLQPVKQAGEYVADAVVRNIANAHEMQLRALNNLWDKGLEIRDRVAEVRDVLKLETNSLLTAMRDALIAPKSPQVTIGGIYVSVASGDPTAIANKIAATLRTQGALA